MQLKTEKMLARKEGGVGWMTFNNPAAAERTQH